MSIFTSLESDFEGWWTNHVKPFLTNDVEPTLKAFMQQFESVFGQQALTAALGAVATLSGGAAFGTVATGLATTLYADAKADASNTAEVDATQILQTVQSALQVAKAANSVVTPSDQTAAAAISGNPIYESRPGDATPTTAPAPEPEPAPAA
jgi:hypothetical protein